MTMTEIILTITITLPNFKRAFSSKYLPPFFRYFTAFSPVPVSYPTLTKTGYFEDFVSQTLVTSGRSSNPSAVFSVLLVQVRLNVSTPLPRYACTVM